MLIYNWLYDSICDFVVDGVVYNNIHPFIQLFKAINSFLLIIASHPNEESKDIFLPTHSGRTPSSNGRHSKVCCKSLVKVTIITTPRNAKNFENAITRDREEAGNDIGFHLLNLDRLKFGLPEDVENTLHSLSAELRYKVFMSVLGLKEPLLWLLKTQRPDCLVSDVVQSWTLDVAKNAGIPRIAFRGSGMFAFCVDDCLRKFKPHENVESDDQAFLLPGLPDPVYMTRKRMPHCQGEPNILAFFEEISKAELDSFAIIVNSAFDLEPGYHNYAKEVMGIKLFALGPVSKFSNKTAVDKSQRGANQSVKNDDEDKILGWLNSKARRSVVYVSFGSEAGMCKEEFHEIAHGLESSGHPFIWVAKSIHYTNPNEPGWFPTGFEERIKDSNQGLIIKGWAPQLLILDHDNVGAFMSHCGWNSSMESMCAGMPFVTWPLSADQFFNECLLVDVLKVGIRVGNDECTYMSLDFKFKVRVTRDKVEVAVRRILSGDEDVQLMRKNVEILAKKAKEAVEKGGSSYNDVYALVDELIARQN